MHEREYRIFPRIFPPRDESTLTISYYGTYVRESFCQTRVSSVNDGFYREYRCVRGWRALENMRSIKIYRLYYRASDQSVARPGTRAPAYFDILRERDGSNSIFYRDTRLKVQSDSKKRERDIFYSFYSIFSGPSMDIIFFFYFYKFEESFFKLILGVRRKKIVGICQMIK